MAESETVAGHDVTRRGFAALTLGASLAGTVGAHAQGARVNEMAVDVKTSDGVCDSYLYLPEGAGTRPGVVMYTNILGVRPAARDMARELAAEGYIVLLPNHYYRLQKAPFDPMPNLGDPAQRAKLLPLAGAVTPGMVERDAPAHIAFLLARPEVNGRLGTVGYCMTGSYAMRTAAAAPDRVVAMASFHGGNLVTDAPDSAHLVLPKIKARMYYAHATNDAAMPDARITQLEAALKAGGHNFVSETYPAAHGWCIKDGPVYDETQARRAWTNLTRLFRETLVA